MEAPLNKTPVGEWFRTIVRNVSRPPLSKEIFVTGVALRTGGFDTSGKPPLYSTTEVS